MDYHTAVQPYASAIRMVRDAIEELFGPLASLESEEAVLLRGPTPADDADAIIEALQRVKQALPPLGERFRKRSGSEWQGSVCGWYKTQLTPIGYAIESEAHRGSVQIYPLTALERVPDEG